MPTEAKRETVAELRDELSRHRTLIVSEYRGLTVRELSEIRRTLRKQAVSYRVVKNRLMRIAAGENASGLASLLTGPTAIAFGNDEAQTAKAVIDATRTYRLLKITGGLLSGDKAISADGVTRLATLPPREVLLGRLAGAIQSPTATFAGLLSANVRNLGNALVQLRDRKAGAA